MIHFLRREVGEELADNIAGLARDGESTVVLAPRFGGKRPLLRSVWDKLAAAPGYLLMQFSVRWDALADNDRLRLTVCRNGRIETHTDGPVELAQSLFSETGKPLILIADGIDSLGESRARKFLTLVRTAVNKRRLVVVLAGERDFRDLVHGPNSEFNCANQFVLQGYDKAFFRRAFDEHCELAALEWTDPDRAFELISEQTRGNGYLLRMQLWMVIDARRKTRLDCTGVREKVNPNSIDWQSPIRLDALPESYMAHVFRHGLEVIASDPIVWPDVEALVNGEEPPARREDLAPDTMEFSGFIRLNQSKRTYHWACPVFSRFCKSYYNPGRMAGLFGRNGDWDEAFRYDRPEVKKSAFEEDETEALLLVRSLEADMHSAASRRAEEVERLFVGGCRWILGLPEIVPWVGNAGPWTPENPITDGSVASEQHKLIETLGENVLVHGRCGVALKLDTLKPESRRALVVSDFARNGVISSRRMALMNRLAEQFRQAQQHAMERQASRKRLDSREQFATITRAILGKVGESLLDVKQALELTAHMLLPLGYRRVLFSLVDYIDRRIVGTVCVPEGPVDLAALTDYSIDDDIEKDVQPWVVHNRGHRRILDAHKDPMVNERCRDEAGLRAFAIVPIFVRKDEVLGTIHVERRDEMVPSIQEIDDLVEFGRQLGGVLEGTERTTLLISALNKLMEPILLLNRKREVVFANEPAHTLFSDHIFSAGWQERPCQMPAAALGDKYVEKALSEPRYLRTLVGVGNNPDYRGRILCAQLKDWRDVMVGGLIHIEDQRFLHKIYDVLTIIALTDKTTVIDALLDSAEIFSFDRARYYARDPKSGALKSSASRGLKSEAHRVAFASGKVVLKDEPSLRCLQSDGLAWKWDREEARAAVFNSYGLEQIVERTEEFEEITEKEPGAVWVDIPLKTDNRVFGKLTLERPPDNELRPEEFENLKVFGKLASAILEAIDDQKTIKAAFEKAMGIMAHQFRNKMFGITSALNGYKLLALERPATGKAIAARNQRFQAEVEELDAILERAPEFLGEITICAERFDLHETFARLRENGMANINVEFDKFPMEADRHHLTTCFSEMIGNAIGMKPYGPKVTIEVRAREENGTAIIEIEDDGPGIKTENKSRIFNLDYSLRPGGQRGTGWGLYFTRRVIEAHGGTIEEVGPQGALFRILIPRWQKAG